MKPVRALFLLSVLLSGPCNGLETTDCISAKKPDLNNDGIVDYQDLWMVGRSYGLDSSDYRYVEKADSNCDRRVDGADWNYVLNTYGRHYPLLPEVNGWIGNHAPKKMYVGRQQTFTNRIELYANIPFSARIKHSITPDEGIMLENSNAKTESESTAKQSDGYTLNDKLQIRLSAQRPGRYRYVFSVEIPESGRSFNDTVDIDVSPIIKSEFIRARLTVTQHSDKKQQMLPFLIVKLFVSGPEYQDITRDIQSISVVDENTRESHHLDTYLKETTIPVEQAFIDNRQCKSLHAEIELPEQTIRGDTVTFCAEPERQRPSLPPQKTDTLQPNRYPIECQDNILSLLVDKRVSEQHIRAIVEAAGGDIVHHDTKEVGIYLVKLQTNAHAMENWIRMYKKLYAYPETKQLGLFINKTPRSDCPIPHPFASIGYDK